MRTHYLSEHLTVYAHRYKIGFLFSLAMTVLVVLTAITATTQVKPNLAIDNTHKSLLIHLEDEVGNKKTEKIKSVTIDGIEYLIKPYWLKSTIQGVLGKEALDEFFEGERILRSAINKPTFVMTENGEIYNLTFTPLRLQDYPWVFYTTRISAAILFFFSLWIYAIAPHQRGAKIAIVGSYCFAICFLVADTSIERQWAMNSFTLEVYLRILEFLSVFYTASVFYLVWMLPKPLSQHSLFKHAPLIVLIILLSFFILSVSQIVNNLLLTYELPYFIIHILAVGILAYKFIFYYIERRTFILEWVTIRWVMLAVLIGVVIPLSFHVFTYIGYLEELPKFALAPAFIFKVGLSALVATSVLYQAEYFWWRLWVFIIGLGGIPISYFTLLTFTNLLPSKILFVSISVGLLVSIATAFYFKNRYIVDTFVAMEDILPKILTGDDKQWFDTKCDAINLPPEGQSQWINVLVYIFKPLTIKYLPNRILFPSNEWINTTPCSMQHRSLYSTHVPLTHSLNNEPNHSNCLTKTDKDTNKGELKVASILAGGARLTVLDFNYKYQIELTGANKGLRLFTNRDIDLINSFWKIMKQHEQTQISFVEGEANERKRIAADLHDDIGGKLLYLASREGELGAYAHETLQDLRILARGLSSDSKPLEHIIADISYKIAEQCELKPVTFELVNSLQNFETQVLNPKDATALTSIFNELTRNALNHNQISFIACIIEQEFKQETGYLKIVFSNDGDVVNMDSWQEGLGIPSIQRRINNWQGKITWHARQTGGVDCSLYIPVAALFNKAN